MKDVEHPFQDRWLASSIALFAGSVIRGERLESKGLLSISFDYHTILLVSENCRDWSLTFAPRSDSMCTLSYGSPYI
jgi:hypothetical protein